MAIAIPTTCFTRACEDTPDRDDIGAGIADAPVRFRSIGDHMREAHGLTDTQVEKILLFQRQRGVRFGEAAVALKLVTDDDVLQALARQFEFPYAPAHNARLSPELVVATDPFGAATELFRDFRSQLLMGVLGSDAPRRALAVTSVTSGAGKSFFAANLALSFTQLGARTLLVDGNLRAPRLHTLFQKTSRTGLSSLLAGKPQSAIASVAGLPNLFLLPGGATPPNPLELLERPALGLLLRDWLARFDQVVVDCPASNAGADARVIAARCGATVVIARRGKSEMKPLQQLVAQLQKSQATFAGVVLNEC